MKIGIFGGRFDPFHDGHLEMVTRGIAIHSLDKIHIVPAANPPHKPVSTRFDDRCAMIELAIVHADLPANQVVVDRREMSRQRHSQSSSWTIDTILEFEADYPPPHELWLMIGDDTARQLHTWYRIDSVLSRVNLLVFNRNNISPDTITRYLTSHFPSFANHLAFDTDIYVPISSSDLRVQNNSPYITNPVAEYIRQNRLYQNIPKHVLGITGRVGSGKSSAAAYLDTHFNVTVLDLDTIGHALLLDPRIKADIRESFGDIVFVDGDINRKALGKIVFSDSTALEKLNRIIHPKIREAVVTGITASKTTPIIVVGALLDETGILPLCDAVWVIDGDDNAIETAIGSKFDIRHSQQSRKSYQAQGTVIKNTFDDRFFDTLDQLFKALNFS